MLDNPTRPSIMAEKPRQGRDDRDRRQNHRGGVGGSGRPDGLIGGVGHVGCGANCRRVVPHIEHQLEGLIVFGPRDAALLHVSHNPTVQ